MTLEDYLKAVDSETIKPSNEIMKLIIEYDIDWIEFCKDASETNWQYHLESKHALVAAIKIAQCDKN